MSQRGSGFERKQGDQYMTPEWCVRSLLTVERIFGPVWEPACGEGAIARVIRDDCPFIEMIESDLDPKYCSTRRGVDFLAGASGMMVPVRWPWTIITNPPYGKGGKLARAFVEHALELAQIPKGKVIMLLPNEWDSAPKRQHLFQDFGAFVGKYTLTKRIRWTNLPQSKNGPSQNHAWFVWDFARKGRDIGWLA